MTEDDCIHGLPESSCGICRGGVERPGVRRPPSRRDYFQNRTYTYLTTDVSIYVAPSGYCVHYDPECHGLVRYGRAQSVDEVSRIQAQWRGLFDCDMCVTPWHRREA